MSKSSNDTKDRIVLIDVNALVHRAYHAYPPQLRTSTGEQINAVYGFTALLLKVIEDLHPESIICAFDSADKTLRHKEFKDYKANRKPVEESLAKQFPRVFEIIKAFNIPLFGMAGYEADDIIGTLSIDPQLKNYEVVIVTGDQDAFQLIDDHIKVYLSGRTFREAKFYESKDVEEKLGIKPVQVVDYKALRGDPSDNIPGVKGIGEKSTKDLLNEFKNIDNLYKNINKVNSKLQKKLIEGKDDAFTSRKLAKVYLDVPIKFKIEECKVVDYDRNKVIKLFQHLQFRSLLAKLPKQEITEKIGQSSKGQNKNLFGNISRIVVTDKNSFLKFLSEIEKIEEFAIDTEATDINFTKAMLLGISFFWGGKSSYYIKSDLIKISDKFTSEGIKLKRVLETARVKKIGHNIKYDMHILSNSGIKLSGVKFDTMIAAYLILGGEGKAGLKELVFNNFGYVMKELNTLLKVRGKRIKMTDLDTGTLGDYACDDAIGTWHLYESYKRELQKDKKLNKRANLFELFNNIEVPLINVLFQMEEYGILVNKGKLETLSSELNKKMQKVEKDIFKFVGHEFNIASPRQVGKVLYDELNLPKSRKTKGGAFSTNERALGDLQGTHPVVDFILEYRELAKIKSTYTTALIDDINIKNGRIHTCFNQGITSTGRLSSSDPNLQNIPIGVEWGKKVREAFLPQDKCILISFDYAQQELRLLAHFSKEENLIEAFKSNIDIHTHTASDILNIPLIKVGKAERRVGKTVNFGIIYGISAFGLSERLKIDRDDAQEFINRYFDNYPNVRRFLDSIVERAESEGEVRSILGRKRNAQGLKSANVNIRNAVMREIINFPLQASAADLMKLAMKEVEKVVRRKYQKANLLLQIHDSLLFEVADDKNYITKFIKEIKEILENVYKLNVPYRVDVEIGKNWGEMQSYQQTGKKGTKIL